MHDAARLQANTINRRLSAVKSMVRMARRLEMCDWTLAEVDGLTVKPYRDTRGITASQFRLMMVFINRFSLAGARDFAMLTLLWEAGLRRSELVNCDVRHFDLEMKRLSILGKGRNEREWIDLTESVFRHFPIGWSCEENVPLLIHYSCRWIG